MLRQAGIDASYNEPTDMYNQMLGGDYTCGMFGHNGAMSGTIFRTLRLYTTGDPNNAWQFSNPEFDAIVEELGVTADEAKVRELEAAAMKIYLEELPEVNLVQFYNRTANNWHYWENWPTTVTDP